MRSRSTITAALAMAAVTILAIAACGSSVGGSAAVNSAAAQTLQESTDTTTSSTSTSRTTSTRTTESTESPTAPTIPTELPTDLSELTSLLSELPSDVSIPSDLSDLNIPGYNPECLTVSLAYASIFLATYPALLGGSETFDAAELQKAISDLSGQVPPEIAADIQALSEVAAEANGKTLTEVEQLFNGEKFTTATKNIEAWTTANCGG